MKHYLVERHATVILKAIDQLLEAGTICGDLAGLLRNMLAFRPADRITAAKAMQHKVWAKTVTDPDTGDEGVANKRARLVSPGSQDVREITPVLELVGPEL